MAFLIYEKAKSLSGNLYMSAHSHNLKNDNELKGRKFSNLPS
ncbi:hypothetical protein MTBBW1_1670082 [Desulfamplus magnetovallimortis]|uniref:Uncharacterized protein n=1 Tax=Desulfamplus magnetovallimortis TaxID=1246637 RepID=A0A1W1H9F1_9BACT|nr:hypothetical protein MTBBW1_1670082 [Desulfamplus magnetovallimortis]